MAAGMQAVVREALRKNRPQHGLKCPRRRGGWPDLITKTGDASFHRIGTHEAMTDRVWLLNGSDWITRSLIIPISWHTLSIPLSKNNSSALKPAA